MLTTTTVLVERHEDDDTDPYEPAVNDATILADGLPAHVSAPSGTDQRIGGDKELVTAVLFVGPSPALAQGDRITDQLTEERYEVSWVRRRTGLGLDHQRAGLYAVKGASNG